MRLVVVDRFYAYSKKKTIKGMTHVQYMSTLYQQLIAFSADDMYEENIFQPGTYVIYDAIPEDVEAIADADPVSHSPKQNDDWRGHSGQRKRVQKNCKVRAMRAEVKRGATTTYFCDSCDFVGPIYLCEKPKWLESNKMMSCWDIWHEVYKNDKEITEEMESKFRVRGSKTTGSPKKSPAKRRRVGSGAYEDSEDSADSD
ncbi:hypothetical protein DVH05_001397 [Phytophthora capsici]|nr:hypothetical protein DVH05_001397 [Phytophthora capsici]